MKIEKMDTIVRKKGDTEEFINPFNYDLYHMGTDIGKNCTIMYNKHRVQKYIIVVDNVTGKRIKVIL